jgi:glycosyltransferase involved in cell wall biosynthesis
MRILFLSHYYPPEVNAPASRTSEHCRAWAAAGHDVTVITCAPNHPAGKIYPGYRNRLHQRETIDGVEVVRVWTLLAANEGFLMRSLNYLSYMVSATLAVPFQKRPDVVISTSPQFFCGLAGLPAKWLRRIPWILEVRDLWPESIVTVGAMRKGRAVRLLEWIEQRAYRSADHIVSVTDSFVAHIAARGGKAERISVIKNGVDLSLFQKSTDDAEAAKQALGLQGKFIAAYVGTHGLAHGLDTILEAAEALKDQPHIAFLMVGDGAERTRLVEAAATRKLANVHILGQRPKADMPGIWSATDASLILLKRSDLFHKVIPSKMFEAMAMQCPIVLGVEGEAKALLEAGQAGMAIEPENARELATAVLKLAGDRELAANYGRQGAAFVKANFDRSVLAARYLGVVEQTMAARAGAVANVNSSPDAKPAVAEKARSLP